MSEYQVTFARSARRELESLDKKAVGRILLRIEALARQPRPPGAAKLRGSRDLWRIRVGDFRVLYRVDDRGRLVDVIAIGDRKEIYRTR